jgi:hypothetical protein
MPNFKLAGKWKELFKDPSESFYNSEMKIQDEETKAGNQQLINQGYPVKSDDPLNSILDESTGKMIPVFRPRLEKQEVKTPIPSGTVDKLRSLLGPQIPTPVVNTFLQNKTAQQYSTDQQELQYAAPIDLIGKAARRLVTLGKQQVDNVPGLNAIATGQEDKMPNLSGALIQAGGRFLPLAGITIQTLNAGPTRAGTLDEARRMGWLK